MMPSVPTILTPDEGVRFAVGPSPSPVASSAASRATRSELYEPSLGGPATIDYHVHNTMDETICVISGNIEFTVAGRKFARPPGRWHSSLEACTTDSRTMAPSKPPS